MARGIMGLYADLGAPLLPLVFATDAEGGQDHDAGGYGVVATRASPEQLEKLWCAGTKPGHAMAKPHALERVLARGSDSLQPYLPVSAVERG